MYLSYEEYMEMGGTADQKAYPRMEFLARKTVDRYTHGRVQRMCTVPEAVRWCIFDLVNSMGENDPTKAATSPSLSGYSNDGYSESYATPVTADSLESGYYSIIRNYLSGVADDCGVPLLYAGVD